MYGFMDKDEQIIDLLKKILDELRDINIELSSMDI